jgi:hypothetical protein
MIQTKHISLNTLLVRQTIDMSTHILKHLYACWLPVSPYQLVRPKGKERWKERGKEKRKGKSEGEEGRRRGKGAASPKKQSRSPITPRKQFWTTPTRGKYISSISTDFSKSLAPRPRLQPTIRLGVGEQQSSVAHLLDRTTYVCQHLLIISGDLSAGNQHWQSTLAIVEHGQHWKNEPMEPTPNLP